MPNLQPTLMHQLMFLCCLHRPSVFLAGLGLVAAFHLPAQAVSAPPPLPLPPVPVPTPPKFMGIEGFESCLSLESKDRYSAWCLPRHQAPGCLRVTWARLRTLPDDEALPACAEPAKSDTPAKPARSIEPTEASRKPG